MKQIQRNIYKRLLNNANLNWNQSTKSTESHYDPLVGLLFGACSWEFAKIEEEITNTKAKATKRATELLSPSSFNRPVPSHAIATATPIDPKAYVFKNNQFVYSKVNSQTTKKNEREKMDVFFSPTRKLELFNCEIKQTGYNNQIFKNNGIHLDFIQNTKEAFPSKSVCVGVKIHPDLEDLNGLRFYFDCGNITEKNLFTLLLKDVKLTINGHEVITKPGFLHSTKKVSLQSIINQNPSVFFEHANYVETFYTSQFLRIEDTISMEKLNQGDASLKYIEMIDDQLQKEDLVWFQFEFSELITDEMIAALQIHVNAFPILNCKYNKNIATIQSNSEIHFLETKDSFFDLDEVSISNSINLPILADDETDFDAEHVRVIQGGVRRFDEKTAIQQTEYLLQLIRDETASFSIIGRDLIESKVKDLNKSLLQVERKMSDFTQPTNDYYAIVKSNKKQKGEVIEISYWSTQGYFANRVHSGSALTLSRGSTVYPSSILLLTSSEGGRAVRNETEQLDSLRSAILSKNRLVTQSDIEHYTYYLFGNLLQNITFKKQVEFVESKDEHAYKYCILIELTPSASEPKKEDTLRWDYLCKKLNDELVTKTSNYLPYKIKTVTC